MMGSLAFLKELRGRTTADTVESPNVKYVMERPNGTLRFVGQADLGVGGQLWEAAPTLSDWLEANRADVIRGAAVLELGSGTGALGMCVALMGPKKVVLSDRFDVLPMLRQNLEANPDLKQFVSVEDISWGEDVHLLGGSDFDCIIASEVIYNGLLYDKLLDTIKKVSSPNTRMIMSYEKRSSEDRWEAMVRETYKNVEIYEKDIVDSTQRLRKVYIMDCTGLKLSL